MQEKPQTKLTKDQIQALVLLSTGVFLVDFDRMLYAYMSPYLNNLFFSQTDHFINSLIPAFAFCSNYFLAPLGAIFFGRLADISGRKALIILSSTLMAICSIILAFLPTYKQIGIAAPIILIIVRMLQGMTAFVEFNGVEIYLTESTKPPVQYSVVALVSVFNKLGSLAALGVAIFFSSHSMYQNFIHDPWRLAFLAGAVVGVVGAAARGSLKEATGLADRQQWLKTQFKKANIEWSKTNLSINPKVPFATSLAYFFINCARPACFYIIFFYCAEVLHNTFGLNAKQVMQNNLLPAVLNLCTCLVICCLSYKIHPLKIIKFRLISFMMLIMCFPLVLHIWKKPQIVLLFQCIFTITRFDYIPAGAIFYKHFPTIKRFRYASLINSLSMVFTTVLTSFGLTILSKKFGHAGILLVFIPFSACFAWSLNYFKQKEKPLTK